MTTTLLNALRLLLDLLCNGPRRAWLRFVIFETEAYLQDCERDGLVHSLHIAEWRATLADLRVQLALLQPPVAAPHPPTPNV